MLLDQYDNNGEDVLTFNQFCVRIYKIICPDLLLWNSDVKSYIFDLPNESGTSPENIVLFALREISVLLLLEGKETELKKVLRRSGSKNWQWFRC